MFFLIFCLIKNKVEILKVPEGLFKKANLQGVLLDIEFWYRLKSLNKEGSLKKGYIEEVISEEFLMSFSSVWRKINRLIKLGWIKKEKTEYLLIKYDKLWDSLGYDLTSNNNKKRLGNFKINKIKNNSYNLKYFLKIVAYEDIKNNLRQQRFVIRNFLKKEKYFELIPKNIWEKIKVLDQSGFYELFNFLIDSKKYSFLENKNFLNKVDSSLSSFGISKILGFKSSFSGHFWQKELEKENFIKIFKRDYILEVVKIDGEKIYQKLKSTIPNLVFKDNLLYFNFNNFMICYK